VGVVEEQLPLLHGRAHRRRGTRIRQSVGEDVLTEENLSRQNEKVRVMLPFLQKLTVSPESMAEADVTPLRAADISDHAIIDAIYVCMLFCTMNRMVDAFGVALMTPKQLDKVSRMLLEKGYDM
jgi:alkylhydroperoxidase family enzyme